MSSLTGIEADFDQLMHQAPETVEIYMSAAIAKIDKVFGHGYSQDHPELVGAFIQAAATDYQASTVGKVLGEALYEIAQNLDSVAAAIGEVALSCNALGDISHEIEGLAEAAARNRPRGE